MQVSSVRHLGKTEYIRFRPKQSQSIVKCNDHGIKSTKKVNYLGLVTEGSSQVKQLFRTLYLNKKDQIENQSTL